MDTNEPRRRAVNLQKILFVNNGIWMLKRSTAPAAAAVVIAPRCENDIMQKLEAMDKLFAEYKNRP